MTNLDCRIEEHTRVRTMGSEVARHCSRPTSKLGQLRVNDGKGPSVDLTREPREQPVWRWGLLMTFLGGAPV
jgi:hypothetical protein